MGKVKAWDQRTKTRIKEITRTGTKTACKQRKLYISIPREIIRAYYDIALSTRSFAVGPGRAHVGLPTLLRRPIHVACFRFIHVCVLSLIINAYWAPNQPDVLVSNCSKIRQKILRAVCFTLPISWTLAALAILRKTNNLHNLFLQTFIKCLQYLSSHETV